MQLGSTECWSVGWVVFVCQQATHLQSIVQPASTPSHDAKCLTTPPNTKPRHRLSGTGGGGGDGGGGGGGGESESESSTDGVDHFDTVGDADYVFAWERILLPVAREFKPDLILVSAGFDAARGDPLGGADLTPGGWVSRHASFVHPSIHPSILSIHAYPSIPPASQPVSQPAAQLLLPLGKQPHPAVSLLVPQSLVSIIIIIIMPLHWLWPCD